MLTARSAQTPFRSYLHSYGAFWRQLAIAEVAA